MVVGDDCLQDVIAVLGDEQFAAQRPELPDLICGRIDCDIAAAGLLLQRPLDRAR